MLDIALLVDSPSRGTFANVTGRVAIGLAETGRAAPRLVVYGSDPAPAWLPPEIPIERLRTDRASRSLRTLATFLRSRQPQVIITRQIHANLVALAATGLARVGRGWSGKLVVGHDHPAELSHATDWKDNKWLVKFGYRFADALITPSPTVSADIVAWSRLKDTPVAVVPIPITPFPDAEVPPPHLWMAPGSPPVFVTTARLVRYKRIDLLVTAFHRLAERHDARLLIVGEGPERRRLDAQISRLGLDARAETVGWVQDPRQFAAHACAFVLPSNEEGFAQVLTEAMSVGCPVIATDALGGGPRFVTNDGQYGILVRRDDAAMLREAMETMLDPTVRARYSALATRRVEAFRPRVCADQLLDFIERSVLPTGTRRHGSAS